MMIKLSFYKMPSQITVPSSFFLKTAQSCVGDRSTLRAFQKKQHKNLVIDPEIFFFFEMLAVDPKVTRGLAFICQALKLS